MNNDHATGFGVGLLTGAIVGGFVALLVAPKSGEKTRQIIRDQAAEGIEAFKEKAGEIMDTANEAASEANRKGHAAVRALKR